MKYLNREAEVALNALQYLERVHQLSVRNLIATYSKPQHIADAIGEPLSFVRKIMHRLSGAEYVVGFRGHGYRIRCDKLSHPLPEFLSLFNRDFLPNPSRAQFVASERVNRRIYLITAKWTVQKAIKRRK